MEEEDNKFGLKGCLEIVGILFGIGLIYFIVDKVFLLLGEVFSSVPTWLFSIIPIIIFLAIIRNNRR